MISLRRTTGRLAAAVAATALMAGMVATHADARPTSQDDSATVTAFQFHTLHRADVIADSSNVNLVVRYAAGHSLTDGTVRVTVPSAQWETLAPLQAVNGPVYSPDRGTVFVRPQETLEGTTIKDPTIAPAQACGGSAGARLQASVDSTGIDPVIVVDHVDCAPGQSLAVRIVGLVGPDRGRYSLPVWASDAGGIRLMQAQVHVKARPKITLHVAPAGPTVKAGVPFRVEITAVGPDGRIDTGYRGAVALSSRDDDDCTMHPLNDTVAIKFTPALAGHASVPVTLDQPGLTHRLAVYDIANRANATTTNRFDVAGPALPYVTCPVSYH
jgi:hypothetical protein